MVHSSAPISASPLASPPRAPPLASATPSIFRSKRNSPDHLCPRRVPLADAASAARACVPTDSACSEVHDLQQPPCHHRVLQEVDHHVLIRKVAMEEDGRHDAPDR